MFPPKKKEKGKPNDKSDRDADKSKGSAGKPKESDPNDDKWEGDFNSEEHTSKFGAKGKDGEGGDADSEDGDKPKGKGARIEPHEDGAGSRVHFHDEVNADLKDGADYKHHVTEHAKHYAGYLTHKDSDPERGEAHRHAANLHARVGNGLHAGGDTKPQPPPMMGMPGDGMPMGKQGTDGEKVGSGSDDSPGADIEGKPQPGMPDQMRNMPGRDSGIAAQRMQGGKPAGGSGGGKAGGAGKGGPPLVFLNKSQSRKRKPTIKSLPLFVFG